jgi:lysine/ornithine N-monooxygenase
LDGTDFETLIVPPSYYKELTHNVILSLMTEAGKEIRSAKKIVFIGYSLSDADIHIKALFKKHLSESHEITVINPKNPDLLKMKYAALSKNVRYCEKTFQELVGDVRFLKEILTT